VNEDMVRRVEEALEERKRQRRKAAPKPEPYPDDRRAPVSGRRDQDHPVTNPAPAHAAPVH
jgi:hypothetical protein